MDEVGQISCYNFTGQSDRALDYLFADDEDERDKFCDLKHENRYFVTELLSNKVGCMKSFDTLFLEKIGLSDSSIDADLKFRLKEQYEYKCIKCSTNQIYSLNYFPCMD